MKNIILLCLIFTTVSVSKGQQLLSTPITYQNFNEEILKFIPLKNPDVTAERFSYAIRILEETKSNAKGNPMNLNVADFWNITSALIVLKEQKELIAIAFKKAIDKDGPSVCSYVEALGPAALSKAIPEIFLPFYANCLQNKRALARFDFTKYAEENHLDVRLVNIVNTISLNDQKFRSTGTMDWNLQRPLDLKNQQLIDSLFNSYKTYIGKDLVGPKLESTMWLVVQHSNLKMMEQYLPVIVKATDDKQLDIIPLKMLMDRIYSIKYNYQVFGSQTGITIADEKTRTAIITKYHIY